MRLLSTCRRFLSDRMGNITILFALAVVPMFGIMGAALDYSMANMQRTALQAAADNTILMLSKMMPMTDENLQTKGWKIFQANMGATPLQYGQVNLNIQSTANGKLTLQIDTEYPLTLGGVMSKLFGTSPYMPVDVHSEVQWGNTRLRVALVLDNTGSMDQAGKMSALKTATTKLLTQLQGLAKDPEDVYISIIPFSKDVNIGALSTDPSGVPMHQTSGFIYWDNAAHDDNDSWDARNGSCSISGNSNRASCVGDSKDMGSCSDPQYKKRSKCRDHGERWTANVVNGTWTPDDHSTWNGCVTDRGTPSGPSPSTEVGPDQSVELPSGTDETLWPAEQFSSCTLQIVGLTNNWTTLDSTVQAMASVGNTNQPIGLVWGWQSLVGGGPLSVPVKDPDYAYSDTIILMSDGLNTENRWTSSSSKIDDRMQNGTAPDISGTCQNIKSANVQIFTVQVNTGGDPTSTLLKNCATNTGMFFELKSADELVDTFELIGSALANIHISK
jgi:Flp pilus assembly protein TadG